MNPFELFSLTVTPLPELGLLKARYLKETERLHPDRIQGGAAEREAAGEKMAELNGAFEILNSHRLRLAWIAQKLRGEAAAKTGRVSGSDADRMMRMAEVCRKVDTILLRRSQAQGVIEIAMLSGEVIEATDEVTSAQAEIAGWHHDLEERLEKLQEEWGEGLRDILRLESLSQSFAYAEKARKQLEERFLKLAESLG
jgi:curved DNA-binding protein CbpA